MGTSPCPETCYLIHIFSYGHYTLTLNTFCTKIKGVSWSEFVFKKCHAKCYVNVMLNAMWMIKFETWSLCFISISMIRMQTLWQKMRARQSSNITATAAATSTWDFLGIQTRNLKHQRSISQIIRHYAATNQTATVAPMVQELSTITDYRFHQGIQGEWVYATIAVLEMWQLVLLRARLKETAVSSHSGLLFTSMQPLVSTGSAIETHRVFSICANPK